MTVTRTPDVASFQPPVLVLDTNVVLDWLVFHDAAMEPLADAIRARRVVWRMADSHRAELAHVLSRWRHPRFPANPPDVLSQVDRWSSRWTDHASVNVSTWRLRCRDADDQKFIDVAFASGATWLLSRDRDVLSLARRARAHGVEIMHPGAWSVAFGMVDRP